MARPCLDTPRPFFVDVDQIRCSEQSRQHPAFAHLVAGSLELVGDEAIAEVGIVLMDVDGWRSPGGRRPSRAG